MRFGRKKKQRQVGPAGLKLYLAWVVAGTAIALPALVIVWSVTFGVPLTGPRLLMELVSSIDAW